MAAVAAWCLIGISIFALSHALAIAAQREPQNTVQAISNAKFTFDLGELRRRADLVDQTLEPMKVDVGVMKSDMAEIKWIARGGAGFIAVQVLMTAFGIPVKRRRVADAAGSDFDQV